MNKLKEKKKPKVMITHGGITHPIGQKCGFCERVKREWKEELLKEEK